MAKFGAEEKIVFRLKNLSPNLVLRLFSVQTTVEKNSRTCEKGRKFLLPNPFSLQPQPQPLSICCQQLAPITILYPSLPKSHWCFYVIHCKGVFGLGRTVEVSALYNSFLLSSVFSLFLSPAKFVSRFFQYAGVNIGPVHRRDIMKCSIMLEHDSQ